MLVQHLGRAELPDGGIGLTRPGDDAGAADFALETACRRGEELRLEWKDYEPKKGTVWLADAKNGRGRFILLTEKAQGLLEAPPGRAEGGRMFKVTGELLKQAFVYARERAATQARAIGRSDLETVATLRWHDFRHEAISCCFDAGWTAEQVMDFSGHVDIKSLLRYRHPRIDDAVARLRRLAPATPPRLPISSDLVGRVVAERVLIES